MRTLISGFSAVQLALVLLFAGGAQASPAPRPSASSSVRAGVVADADRHGGGGGGDDGGRGSRRWICQASVNGGGPLFYATGCDLSQTMQYAIDTCERQMHSDCFQRGCMLDGGDTSFSCFN